MSVRPLDLVRSVKVKLGLLVAASVIVAITVAGIGSAGGVPVLLSVPVTIVLALAVTQLLAVGMTSPLREMTHAANRMSSGDHSVRVTASSRDEVGELARAFNRMAEDLAEVDRHRRELVANVSHELRTPLAALSAVLENLADGVTEPDPETLRAALAQGERMTALVTDLLDLSRVDAGKTPLASEDVDVTALLEAAAAESRVGGRDVSYQVDVSPADLVVRGDAARLRQLVANLLDNASRHSPPSGTVTISAAATDDHWHVDVTDEGPGVSQADRERAFERFGTLSDLDGGGGTGLGLAIARWVTDLHGGTIRFIEPETRGAHVRADLPLNPTRVAPKEITMTTPTPPTVTMTAPPPVPPKPPSTAEWLFGDMWPERDLPANVPIMFGAIGVGVLAGLVLPFRDLGLAYFLVLLAAGGVLFAASRRRNERFTMVCAALCVALASVTVLRDAEWIAVLCILAGAVVCAAGLVGGNSVRTFALSVIAWPLSGVRGMPWLGRTLRALSGQGNKLALVRTIVLSVLALTVFALLFGSADALFAEWIGALVPDFGSDDLALRLFITFAIGGVVLAGAYLAQNPPESDRVELAARPVANRFEWLAPVLVVDAVFAVFLVAQATVIFGGHDYLERTTGLTYAEYVHQGFGQLTVATALTLLVVWAASRKAPRETAEDRLWIRISLGVLCALTLVVVASALYRMDVYQDAYGFTALRVLVDIFEGWLGLLVVATMVGGLALKASWLPRFGLFSGIALLLTFAMINPEAWIARQNIERFESTGKIDWTYLQTLSDDALPTLATLPDDQVMCALKTDYRKSDDDWLEWNIGRARANSVFDKEGAGWSSANHCPGQTVD
jgi:signal transduction histidine kinase